MRSATPTISASEFVPYRVPEYQQSRPPLAPPNAGSWSVSPVLEGIHAAEEHAPVPTPRASARSERVSWNLSRSKLWGNLVET